eukprot:CAMPEP_0185263528 /NCGR_PEP_ID=MMETSP1359-20130426/15267_1 /TAXON_ID=552665 /ORGANISM="Bigelowiella longifila, Strain CCMP242" /LENGTH=211 /DNA_ID=CAMNT_0027851117 /DNA_START=73 /DNA_END=708 /DNA_ORIENTATION=-
MMNIITSRFVAHAKKSVRVDASQENKQREAGSHIVVALDASHSDEIIEWGAKNVFDKAKKITFLHATEYVGPMTFSAASDEVDFQGGTVIRKMSQKLKREAIERGEDFLSKCSEASGDMGFYPDEQKVVLASNSSIKYTLLAYLENERPDLVVCGSRGLGIAGRAVLGSVADSLVHNAGCTVVVVKNDHRHPKLAGLQNGDFSRRNASQKD